MWLNHDPEGSIQFTQEQIDAAIRLNGFLIVVHSSDNWDENAKDYTNLSFITIVNVIPRTGEIIFLEDKTKLKVVNVFHKVITKKQDDKIKSIYLVIHVICDKVKGIDE